MTEENTVQIKKSRHALYEIVVPAFIENDTSIKVTGASEELDIDDTSIIVLTGANFRERRCMPLSVH
jgi:DNA mismatch repair ATPase MutS